MGVRTVAIIAHSLGAEIDLAAHLRERLPPVFDEASAELARWWGDPSPETTWDAGPGDVVRTQYVRIRRGPASLVAHFRARWRGFVAIPELREPIRVMAWALRETFGTDEPVIYLGDEHPLVYDALDLTLEQSRSHLLEKDGPISGPLSRAFRGWDRPSYFVDDFADVDPQDAMSVHRYVAELRSERIEELSRLRPTEGALADIAMFTKDGVVSLEVTAPQSSERRALFMQGARAVGGHFAREGDRRSEILKHGHTDLCLECTAPDQPASDAAYRAWCDGSFDHADWLGVLDVRYGSERLLRLRADEGDPWSPPELDGPLASVAIGAPQVSVLLDIVESAFRKMRTEDEAELIIEARFNTLPYARLRVPASLIGLALSRGGGVEVHLERREDLDLWRE